jgi:hypothetical protein
MTTKPLFVIAVIISLLLPNFVFGAIVFDSIDAGQQGNPTTTLSFVHTVTTTANNALICSIVDGITADNVTNMNASGTPMTRMITYLTSTTRYSAIWYALGVPTGNVLVTATGTSDYMHGLCVSYAGVKQSGFPDASSTHNTASGVTILQSSVTTTADNSWPIMWSLHNGTVPNAGPNTVFRGYGPNAAWAWFDKGSLVTPAGSSTLSSTSTIDTMDQFIFSIAPYTSGAVTTTYTGTGMQVIIIND